MLLEFLEYLLIAFVCSVILIFLSKVVLQALIRRPADYYLAEEYRQERLMLKAAGLTPFQEHHTDLQGDTLAAETITEEVAEAEEHLFVRRKKKK